MTSKRFKEAQALVDPDKLYSLEEGLEVLLKAPKAKFDETVEVAFKMGLDTRKADQQVRTTVALPHGTGKTLRVLVLTKGDKVQEAEAAGADFAGAEEFIDRIKGGWTDFDAVVATPDMMRDVGKLGKILGPRGLMPTPKAGTVTTDVSKAVTELKAGKIEFRTDRYGVINSIIGKLSFTKEQLVENAKALATAINRAKPSGAKGIYILSVAMAPTMGPGVKIDLRETPTV
jgi:large subunit ribosomal protein L1